MKYRSGLRTQRNTYNQHINYIFFHSFFFHPRNFNFFLSKHKILKEFQWKYLKFLKFKIQPTQLVLYTKYSKIPYSSTVVTREIVCLLLDNKCAISIIGILLTLIDLVISIFFFVELSSNFNIIWYFFFIGNIVRYINDDASASLILYALWHYAGNPDITMIISCNLL